jgi:hypothetical protein
LGLLRVSFFPEDDDRPNNVRLQQDIVLPGEVALDVRLLVAPVGALGTAEHRQLAALVLHVPRHRRLLRVSLPTVLTRVFFIVEQEKP